MVETNRAEESPIKKMDSKRIKEIQQETAHSESVSVQQALLKVWNECAQQSQSEIDELTKEKSLFIEKYTKSCNEVQKLEKVNDELTKEVERLRKERESNLKEKMYFNRMKELVSKVAYDSEHYTKKSYEVLRRDAIGLLDEYNLTTH